MGKFLAVLALWGQAVVLFLKNITKTPEERKRERKLSVDEAVEKDKTTRRPDNSFWKGR